MDIESAQAAERIPVSDDSARGTGAFDAPPRCPPRLQAHPRAEARRRELFAGVPDAWWNDWRWQLRNRLTTATQLERMMVLSREEREAFRAGPRKMPVAVTPYYATLLDREDPDHPLRRTVIPRPDEMVRSLGELDDPLGEEDRSPVPGLVHRYPDRVLLLVQDRCATYCRYCTRGRLVGRGEVSASRSRLEAAIEYIRRAPAVRDVLVSGGDPLLLSDRRIDALLSRLRRIPHVEIIRIGTKVPAVLPQRITAALCDTLRRHHPVWMSLHFEHPEECTPEAFRACTRLADVGIPLGSQTVLLLGVNDDVATMKELVQRLLMMRVRPYYLLQCDPIRGSAHLRTPLAKGLEIVRGLRCHTTGYAVPTFIVDLPGGGGKVALQPDDLVRREGDELVFRSYQGQEYRYPDPAPRI